MDSKLAHANQCDLENLLKFMSVRNGSEGLRKLYKLMSKAQKLPQTELKNHFLIYYSCHGPYVDETY